MGPQIPTISETKPAQGWESPNGLSRLSPADLLGLMRSGDRDSAAEFLARYGSLIRRRVRGKLGAGMRRLFDSQEILSTVGRRLDRYVRNGRLQAASEAQLWSLLFEMAETAVVDKVRAYKRLETAEAEDGPWARSLLNRMRSAERESVEGAEFELERAFQSLRSETDRQVLSLWLGDVPLFRIAEALDCTPAAVRQRWQAIRLHLRHQLEVGTL